MTDPYGYGSAKGLTWLGTVFSWEPFLQVVFNKRFIGTTGVGFKKLPLELLLSKELTEVKQFKQNY
ncbi:MAG: hypothetical protein WD315_04045 [Balneolaceae bacterium]